MIGQSPNAISTFDWSCLALCLRQLGRQRGNRLRVIALDLLSSLLQCLQGGSLAGFAKFPLGHGRHGRGMGAQRGITFAPQRLAFAGGGRRLQLGFLRT